jgi:RHH-type rel operon transcriptional repressor/antitoxin RelB
MPTGATQRRDYDKHRLAQITFLPHRNDECHYIEGHPMASINIRIDDDLKARAYCELEKLGVTPSELMRQALQYVAERGQLPFRPVLMTEGDEALIATVRERLAEPQRVKVSLDDL